MAETNPIKIAKTLTDTSKEMFEQFKKLQEEIEETLNSVIRSESAAREREKLEKEREQLELEAKARAEAETAERERQLMLEKEMAAREEEETAKADTEDQQKEKEQEETDTNAEQVHTTQEHTVEVNENTEDVQSEKPKVVEPNGRHNAVRAEGATKSQERRAPRDKESVGDARDKGTASDGRGRQQDRRNDTQRQRQSQYVAVPIQNSGRDRSYDSNKSSSRYDSEKQIKNNKAKMKAAAPMGAWSDDETPMGNRRKAQKKKQPQPVHKVEPIKIDKAVLTSETVTVKALSEKIGKPVAEIIKKLLGLGVFATINQEIDYDTAALVCTDFDIELELQLAKSFEEVLTESAEDEDDEAALVSRPPVITIMGHVDHGKTSLLDAIRHSNVTEGEAGGITQHIGAYQVTCNDRPITFIDTPGHEAFTSMRARGAQVTDIVILVVAADDGIMPQTIEAINHSKAAGVPIIVAVNKIDKEGANPERIKMQLTEHDLVVEDYGGDVICVPISAKKKQNIEGLLEMVLLQADMLELRANPNRLAKGTIVEAELHKGKGPVATVLVQNGTLKIGDPIVAGTAYGHVRAMMDDKGRRVTKAGPSTPVQVLGFNEVPAGGDILNVAEIDKLSRQVAEERRDRIKAEQIKAMSKVSLNDLFSQIAEGNVKELNIIVKADVQGSVEAVKQALEKLSTPEVRVKCIHGGVGAVTSNDIMFASASNAIVIGFNVRPDAAAKQAAERENVDMRLYRIIYQAIEDVQKAMQGLFEPEFREVELGRISVRNTFRVSGVGTIAGAYVQDGKVARNAQVRVVRDGIVIHEGKISSLKRFKDDAKEVTAGYECGIGLESFNDIQEGDTIEAFMMEEIKRI